MMALTRWFGVTESDAERCPAREKADIDEITVKSVLMQKNAATAQHRSLCRGTHASGVCVRAQFEIFNVGAGRAPEPPTRRQGRELMIFLASRAGVHVRGALRSPLRRVFAPLLAP